MLDKITESGKEKFQKDGFLIVKGFYSLEKEIFPVQEYLRDIISIVGQKNGFDEKLFEGYDFDGGFVEMITSDRRLGSIVYDAIKQSPCLVRLAASRKHDEVMKFFRDGSLPGSCGSGFGVRMDVPGEKKFSANWHQEFPTQLRSSDGLIFWTPLVPMSKALGPVRLCRGSHLAGVFDVEESTSTGKEGAYAIRIKNELEVIGRYEIVSPILDPGDVLIMDWMLVHASSDNVGNRVRWSIQSRSFNFRDSVGIDLNWKGAFSQSRLLDDGYKAAVEKINENVL